LNEASDAVTNEMHKLDHAVDDTYEEVNRAFQAFIDVIERRRDEVLSSVKKIAEEKKNVLKDQMTIIETERKRVQDECDGLQYQVEVRNITKKIAHLNNKIDSVSTLIEPRENAFLRFTVKDEDAHRKVTETMQNFGRIATSKTFPGLCLAKARKAVTHLASEVIVYAVDYNGEAQVQGGDPLESSVKREGADTGEEEVPSKVVDHGDGSYSVVFTPVLPGVHLVSVRVFGRSIKESPLQVEVLGEHNPDVVYGSKGSGKDQFNQPVGIAIDDDGFIYVADTGNSRIKVISPQLKETKHIVGDALEGRSVTGLTLTPSNSLMFCNWRKKTVTEVTSGGELLSQFNYESLQEPTTLAVNSQGEILVVDNASNQIFVFLPGGKFVRKWGSKGCKEGQLGSITAICCSSDDDVISADSRLQVFSSEGEYLRTIFQAKEGEIIMCYLIFNPTKFISNIILLINNKLLIINISSGKGPKGSYGGLFLDPKGFLLASRQEKSASCIQIFDFSLGTLIFTIDSKEAKLRRPSGLATTQEGYVIIVDLGNDCIKKFSRNQGKKWGFRSMRKPTLILVTLLNHKEPKNKRYLKCTL
ncbi:E3 ubiquitin-protein ligase TRIM71, partial [Armadillidium nasatum]